MLDKNKNSFTENLLEAFIKKMMDHSFNMLNQDKNENLIIYIISFKLL